ncbi:MULTISPECIES: acyl-CoA dehydrogenase family protein [unclassified Streptomyces]|uniref:acyl-CoA dehydrogenase family protein n=1 Tax=unclassified Streptomyces TaxID=2593676 RepID=UPI002251408A|nr:MULTISPECIES: acyl-CoA dehydrogenase family protein [unclassified Streptomyces]WSP56202.1 acyl-CoA/acyl-ACP dehydrogenase [Streptomyces sp. NBC_01241]WSU23099.1 acyl-CoA/acyl-ACP dehydrogenase [Streptomyces sp. NBC_01108]MCX4787912.1 acyl-CoA/acyl-ACP dehydrogenase [Streptomyces sp. NBC_01221]MCX4796325.1 acyl-CoA/acyl-ACP dehydrogenase [Streptomyces sp. NBC_01242]WSJ37567.1 acyl-CoA/acyl-ACP dehydrogenase [Streptomyces sp. NBC_01321]
MDFTFTEEQQAATEAARAVLSGVAPDGVPSPALVPGAVAEDIDRTLWARLATGDLLGLTLSPEHGGAGLDLVALCLVLRESAKVLARVPLLETCTVAMALQRYGDPGLAAELLPLVGRGELVLTVGANGRSGHDPAELAVTAHRDVPTRSDRPGEVSGKGPDEAPDEILGAATGDASGGAAGWVLDGVQSGVPWAQAADWIAVPAHTGDGRAVLALIRPADEGVTLAEQVSTSGELFAEVRLDSVRINSRSLIDTAGAWEWLRALLTTGTCALALGLGEAVLAMTSEYTGKREQFGFPVATFQSVAVQAADRYIDLRAMEVTLWQAAWRISTGADSALPPEGDIAVAKIWASDGVRRVVQTAQHLHGGFGADTDYPLHRFHAWAKQIELSLGPAAAHEESLGDLLAAHLLG